jgi:pimeloyl-ACP methyl ester carboxylesterase
VPANTPVRARADAFEFRTASGLAGLSIVLQRRPPLRARSESAPVLFVHGATFPSGLAADFPFGGRPWMETLAARGRDTWALDFLGYGKSDRYPEMVNADAAGVPLGDSKDAAVQIAAAAALVRDITQAPRVCLIAHSWGCIPAARFVATHPQVIERFVMFAPVVSRAGPHERSPEQRFWDVSADYQRRRFAALVPAGVSPLIEPADLEPWLESYLASDPTSALRAPSSARVPYGPTADINCVWNGVELFDPAEIRVPTLIVFGEWDLTTTTADALRLYRALTHAPERQLTLLDRGTHIMHLELARTRLYAAVTAFLRGKEETDSCSTISQVMTSARIESAVPP